MRVTIKILSFIFIIVCLSASSYASDGKIPVYQATTIMNSGSYYLTADIVGIIIIDADYVTLNLEGHTVNGTIQVPQPHTNIRITNGKVESGGMIDMMQGGNYYRVDNLQIDTGSIYIGIGTHMIVEDNSLWSINFDQVENGRIARNTIINSEAMAGITLSMSKTIEILNNTVSNVQTNGIYLSDSHDNIISYNDSSANSANGISLEACNNNKITHNNFSGNKNNGIQVLVCNNNTIAYNVISANDSSNQGLGNGIFMEGCDANKINHNTISGNEVDGIQANISTNNKIADNNASSNGQNGYNLINNCMNNSLDWNHASNNQVGFNFGPTTMQNIYGNNRALGNIAAGYQDPGGLNVPVIYGAGFPTNY